MAPTFISALTKYCAEVGADLSDKCLSPEVPQSPTPSSLPAPHFLYATAPPPKTITIHKSTYGPKETVRVQVTPDWAESVYDLHIALPDNTPSSSPTGSLPFLRPVSPLFSGFEC
ncbi:hypothetical protein RQP46_005581 [Phenoliferia psychrophenolica]